MRIITLGTGAGRPTLKRLTSAVGLEFEGQTFLFDCGEGVQIQLIRSSLKWGKITAIFISHMHGDHLNGLPGLLGTLSLSERALPLKLFGPKGMKSYLDVLSKTKNLWINYPLELVEIEQGGMILEGEKYLVEAAPLAHSIECWGYRFCEKDRPGKFDLEKAEQLKIPPGPLRSALVQGKDITLENGVIVRSADLVGLPRPGRKAVFCWDTRPCPASIELAREANILFHEGTFAEDFVHEAHAFGHSTAADAAKIAREAHVKRLVLTHISQRYQDDRLLLEEAQTIFPNTEIAVDMKEFKLF